MRAIVTGAGGDIGGGCARLLAQAGTDVFVVDADRDAAERVAQQINESPDGGTATPVTADVSRSADVQRYVAAAAAGGPLDAVVHAAGIAGPVAALPDYDEADFDRLMAVNVRGMFLGLKYTLPVVRDGGAVVNIASAAGIMGFPMIAAYTASKHAVVGLTRTAALEGAPRRVRVNAVCPGPVEGRMMAEAAGGQTYAPADDPFLTGVPLARYGHPNEIAETVSFLISPAAAFITGAAIVIDGGLTISPS